MKFPTVFNVREIRKPVFTDAGSRTRIIYAAEYDEKGRMVFNEVGKEDTYAYIQSFADSVDIYSILDRYQNGELDVLERVQGFYLDVHDMPTSYQDVLNMNLKTQKFFDELPVEVKKEFDNSYGEFMVALGSKEFDERIKNAMSVIGDDVLAVGAGLVPDVPANPKVDSKDESKKEE